MALKESKQFHVLGMHCAACSARVEKAVSAVAGVEMCAVNLLTNSMVVSGNAENATIIKAVQDAGYDAISKSDALYANRNGGEENTKQSDEDFASIAYSKMKKRLLFSICALLLLMFFSMSSMLHLTFYSIPQYGFWMGICQLALTVCVMWLNRSFFINGFKGFLHNAPNMDSLVALGSGAAFVYSVLLLLQGEDTGLYFESAAMILVLITVGKTLEARAKGKTTDALKGLMRLSPKTATVFRGGNECSIPVSEVCVGDTYLVRPGEIVPLDGTVLEGVSAVNEAALTGESIPVDKVAGCSVSAGTMNMSGFLTCRSEKTAEDTTLSEIIRLVSDASSTKAPIAKTADRVSGVFVPIVLVLAILTFCLWLLNDETPAFAMDRAISVLVISCPCALGLATPVAIMVGCGVGARCGTLFKSATALEEVGRVRIVAMDKTGTLTKGEPKVTGVYPAEGESETSLLTLAASLEKGSEHPLAKAVLLYADEIGIVTAPAAEIEEIPGIGITGVINGLHARGGRADEAASNFSKELLARCKPTDTVLYFTKENQPVGIITVAVVLRDDSAAAVAAFRKMGIRTVLLTGDGDAVANAVCKETGIDEIHAKLLPGEKDRWIQELKRNGKVAMIGDGINDAPALADADVGIAIGAGTDIAMDAADVVLVKSNLTDAVFAIALGRATLRTIHQNLFWAFFYNAICIPLAAGVWFPIFGWKLNPMIGAAAMSLSSFCVVMNALRLNRMQNWRMNGTIACDNTTDRNRQATEGKRDEKMEKRMQIEGMMCVHCEARVKKCLEALDGVERAEVSHEKGTAVLTLSKDISDETLKQIVEAEGYIVK